MSDQRAAGLSRDTDVEEYIEAVVARFGAIPDRDNIIDELRTHLEEVRAENAPLPLRDVLGEPAAYADELRATAGLPPFAAPKGAVRTRTASMSTALRRHAPDFFADLRAIWWGFCGLGLGLFTFALIPAVHFALAENEYAGMWSYTMSPQHVVDVVASTWGYAFGMATLAVLLLVGVLVAVWVGGTVSRGIGPRWARTAVTIVGVLLAVWLVGVLWTVVTTAVSARQYEFIQNNTFPPTAPW